MALPKTIDQVTPGWLTKSLQNNERIGPGGQVTSIAVDGNAPWNVAETAFLQLEGRALGSLPRRLFAKLTTSPDPLERFMPGEYVFYSSGLAAGLPVPECHLALRDEETGGTLVLIDDLRASHRDVEWPYPPAYADCERAVRALAAVHAGTRRAGTGDLDGLLSRETELCEMIAGMLPAFFDFMGDALSRERRQIIEAAIGRYVPLKQQRYGPGQFLCISHGDTHLWNFLYPKSPDTDACVLIDWEHWYEDFGGTDLALMITQHWYPERRARFEVPLLKAYLEALYEGGVPGYGFADLMEDYRLAHICNIIVPIYQSQGKHHGWWSNLERWFLALDDLGARDYLE
ncbi:MAG: aminoglycoside phosphotransferase family protein [Pseudomonadota bacterium]